jgi:hypothetical protein
MVSDSDFNSSAIDLISITSPISAAALILLAIFFSFSSAISVSRPKKETRILD